MNRWNVNPCFVAPSGCRSPTYSLQDEGSSFLTVGNLALRIFSWTTGHGGEIPGHCLTLYCLHEYSAWMIATSDQVVTLGSFLGKEVDQCFNNTHVFLHNRRTDVRTKGSWCLRGDESNSGRVARMKETRLKPSRRQSWIRLEFLFTHEGLSALSNNI